MGKTFQIVNDDISDGYHTFTELYKHRYFLFLALCMQWKDKVYYKKDYENFFCIYLELEEGQISYHVPNIYLELAEKNFTHSPNHVWDGHTSDDVLSRLFELIHK
jgi:hypothetical protein